MKYILFSNVFILVKIQREAMRIMNRISWGRELWRPLKIWVVQIVCRFYFIFPYIFFMTCICSFVTAKTKQNKRSTVIESITKRKRNSKDNFVLQNSLCFQHLKESNVTFSFETALGCCLPTALFTICWVEINLLLTVSKPKIQNTGL